MTDKIKCVKPEKDNCNSCAVSICPLSLVRQQRQDISSAFTTLLECAASTEKPAFEERMMLMFAEDLPALDRQQLGKVYRYMRRVRAGLDR